MEHITNEHDNDSDSDGEWVNIKLRKGNIEYLLGAARLGIPVENWGYSMWVCSGGSSDSGVLRWSRAVMGIIDEVKRQTGVDFEHYFYGTLKTIDELVFKYCQDLEKETHERLEKECVEEEKK